MIRQSSKTVDEPLKLAGRSLGFDDVRLPSGQKQYGEALDTPSRRPATQKALALVNLWEACLRCEATAVLNNDGCSSNNGRRSPPLLGQESLEELVWDLFRLHDLDGDGFLSEGELVRINEAISEIHTGSYDKAESSELRAKYEQLFRDQLDPEGRPVPYGKFRDYIIRLVEQYDKHSEAQVMIVEQWVAEAHTARLIGVTGAARTPTISSDPNSTTVGSSKSFCPPSTKSLPSHWLLGCCLAQRSVTPASDICIATHLE